MRNTNMINVNNMIWSIPQQHTYIKRQIIHYVNDYGISESGQFIQRNGSLKRKCWPTSFFMLCTDMQTVAVFSLILFNNWH